MMSLLRNTLTNQLPPLPRIARKSRRRAWIWGAVYTDHASRSINERKEREEADLGRKQPRELAALPPPFIPGVPSDN